MGSTRGDECHEARPDRPRRLRHPARGRGAGAPRRMRARRRRGLGGARSRAAAPWTPSRRRSGARGRAPAERGHRELPAGRRRRAHGRELHDERRPRRRRRAGAGPQEPDPPRALPARSGRPRDALGARRRSQLALRLGHEPAVVATPAKIAYWQRAPHGRVPAARLRCAWAPTGRARTRAPRDGRAASRSTRAAVWPRPRRRGARASAIRAAWATRRSSGAGTYCTRESCGLDDGRRRADHGAAVRQAPRGPRGRWPGPRAGGGAW